MVEELASSVPPTGDRPPVKKALFKRPAWAKTSSSSPGTNNESPKDDSFSRENYAFRQMRLERAERAKREQEQKKQEQEEAARMAKMPSNNPDEDEDDDGLIFKKRRISGHDAEGGSHGSENAGSFQARPTAKMRVSQTTWPRSSTQSPTKPKPHVNPYLTRELINDKTTIIDLDDGDFDSPNPEESQEKEAHNASYFSDEKVFDNVSEDHRPSHLKSHSQTRPSELDTSTQDTPDSRPVSQYSQPSGPDPTIKLLITSRISDAEPVIVHRKASQRLKEVRLAWCNKQGFSDERAASVFLTWRGRRIFDVTTCKSLGISVDDTGAVFIRGDRDRSSRTRESGGGDDDDEDDDDAGQLHMEAVTQEIFEDDVKARERQKAGNGHGHGGAPGAEGGGEPAKAAASGIKIILKAKEYEEYKLLVKPTTKFGQIASVFKAQRGVPQEKKVSLMFDGDRLDENDEMQDSEVGDMETIEVYVKS